MNLQTTCFRGFRNLDPETGTIAKVLESKSLSPHTRSKDNGLVALAVVGQRYSDDAVLRIAERLPEGQVLWAFSPSFRRISHPKLFRCTHVPAQTKRIFQRKILSHIDGFLKKLPAGTKFSPQRLPFPETARTYAIENFDPLLNERHTATVVNEGVPFEFFADLRKEAEKLVVFGQDAITRTRLKLPYFFRWKWSHRIGASVMIWNDPTLYLNESLDAGWWIGTSERDYAAEGVELVRVVMDKLGIQPEDVLFIGISAGGFSAMQMATLLPGSKALADIPYLTLLASGHIGKVANQAVSSCLGYPSASEVPADLLPRVDVIARMEREDHIPEFLVLQNTQDRRHMESQFGPFRERVPKMRGFDSSVHRMVEYSQRSLVKGGHFPLKESVMLRIIDQFLAGDCTVPDVLSKADLTRD